MQAGPAGDRKIPNRRSVDYSPSRSRIHVFRPYYTDSNVRNNTLFPRHLSNNHLRVRSTPCFLAPINHYAKEDMANDRDRRNVQTRGQSALKLIHRLHETPYHRILPAVLAKRRMSFHGIRLFEPPHRGNSSFFRRIPLDRRNLR